MYWEIFKLNLKCLVNLICTTPVFRQKAEAQIIILSLC